MTWGKSSSGGDSSHLAAALVGVRSVAATEVAFAALKQDGSVVAWGDSAGGGDISSVQPELSSGVLALSATDRAFAALKSDGSVVAWGEPDRGGDSSSVAALLGGEVYRIVANDYAFAALKLDGTVVTWGRTIYGGDASFARLETLPSVRDIVPGTFTFAALVREVPRLEEVACFSNSTTCRISFADVFPGETYHLQRSIDLLNWLPVPSSNFAPATKVGDRTVTRTPGVTSEFFRLVPGPEPTP